MVYRLAELDSGKPVKRTQFPIEDAPKGFMGRQSTYLKGVNKTHVAAIEALQPYNGVKWTKALRDLSNGDKHMALQLIGYVTLGAISVGRTEEEAKAVGGYRRPGDDVSMYYPAPLLITFMNGPPVEITVKQLLAETRQVVGAFDLEFEGKPLTRTLTYRVNLRKMDDPPGPHQETASP